MNFNILRYIALAAVAVASVRVCGQDLLAAQAPVDRQMAKIDSVVLNRLIRAENYEYPAQDLYPEWSNEYAHKYTNVVMPDSLVIDLTGFCMPTKLTRANWQRRLGGVYFAEINPLCYKQSKGSRGKRPKSK